MEGSETTVSVVTFSMIVLARSLKHSPSSVTISCFVDHSWHSFLPFLVVRPANEASSGLIPGLDEVLCSAWW